MNILKKDLYWGARMVALGPKKRSISVICDTYGKNTLKISLETRDKEQNLAAPMNVSLKTKQFYCSPGFALLKR